MNVADFMNAEEIRGTSRPRATNTATKRRLKSEETFSTIIRVEPSTILGYRFIFRRKSVRAYTSVRRDVSRSIDLLLTTVPSCRAGFPIFHTNAHRVLFSPGVSISLYFAFIVYDSSEKSPSAALGRRRRQIVKLPDE